MKFIRIFLHAPFFFRVTLALGKNVVFVDVVEAEAALRARFHHVTLHILGFNYGLLRRKKDALHQKTFNFAIHIICNTCNFENTHIDTLP